MPAMMEEFPIADFFGGSAAHAGTGDDRRTLAQLLGPFNSRRGHGFPGSNHGKLREFIHEAKGLAGKVVFRDIPTDRASVLETNLIHAHFRTGPDIVRHRADSGLTTDKCLPEPYLVKAQSADDAHS